MANPCPAQMLEDIIVRSITLMGISGLDTDDKNVVRRELPERIDSDPPLTCIVCIGKERMPALATHERRSNSTNTFEYPALVVVTKKTALPMWKADPFLRETRKTIRDFLFCDILVWRRKWSDSTTQVIVTNRCVYIPEPAINTVGFQRDIKVSAQLFLYRVEESRKA